MSKLSAHNIRTIRKKLLIKNPLTVNKSVVILSCDVKKGQACHLPFFVKLCANSKSLLYFHPPFLMLI